MSTDDPKDEKLQGSNRSQTDALKNFAVLMGIDPDLLTDAYETLKEGSEIAGEHSHVRQRRVASDQAGTRKKNFIDKELIYDDEHAILYKRGDTKSNTYYLRIYDDLRKKPYVKSLGTTDRAKALVTARTIYQEIKGKIDRGERITSITSDELIKKYLETIYVTDIPHQGCTPATLNLKKYYLNIWLEFINELGLSKTTIDRLPDEQVRHFATWFRNRPRKDGRAGARSVEQINNAVSEVKHAFNKVGVRDRFVSSDKVPNIDRLKQQPDDRYKRDIMELDQYEKYWRYLEYKYQREKSLTGLEKNRRVVFTKAIGILANTGLRPKELLGLRWIDISHYPNAEDEDRKRIAVIHIRKENSKTGRARNCVAPVRKRFDVIKSAYKEIGIDISPTDFIFFNPCTKERTAYTRQTLYCRLKDTIKLTPDLQDELNKMDRSISLYSFRHQYICWRLRYGNVPIHLIARNCGTSIQKIDSTYGHIETEKQIELITRNQGLIQKADLDLSTTILDTEDE